MESRTISVLHANIENRLILMMIKLT